MSHGSTEVSEDEHVDRIIDFLKKIGIEVREGSCSKKAFMPGIWVDGGALVVDRQALLYPGDLLHEAGHLAVMTPDRRSHAAGSVGSNLGEEIAAQAWSYAAALAAGIPLEVVFHDNGYHGAGPWLRELFAGGGTAGVPLLVWYGMTQMPGTETDGDAVAFPRLSTWLRTTPHPPYPPMPANTGPC
jgi:hypothetical protein